MRDNDDVTVTFYGTRFAWKLLIAALECLLFGRASITDKKSYQKSTIEA